MGHAEGMHDAHAFKGMMQAGGTKAQMTSTTSHSSISIVVTITITARANTHQAAHQAHNAQQHLCGCSHANQGQFNYAADKLGGSMTVLQTLIDGLTQSIDTAQGDKSTRNMLGLFGQLESIMNLMKVLGNLMQMLQGNAFGQTQAPASAKPHEGGIQAGVGRLQQLLQMLQQLDGGIQQIQAMSAGNTGGGQQTGGVPGAGQTGGAPAPGFNFSVQGQFDFGQIGRAAKPNYDALPEMAQGKWAAQHGGYQKTDDGYKITKGDLAGHTLVWNAKIKAHLVIDAKGHVCGKWTPKHENNHTKVASPIAFDMNGDGQIGTTGQTTAKDGARAELGRTVAFDIDGDGKANTIEWMAGDGDALLVDNRDGNAADDMSGKRLFGDEGGKYSDGYAKLSTLDRNGDGALTGSELQGLALWKDDGDAIVEEGELVSVSEADVTRISAKRTDVQNAKGETLMRSDADVAGQTIMTEDVWFGEDQ